MGERVPHVVRWLVGAGLGALVLRLTWNTSFFDEDWNRAAAWATIAVAVVVAEALPDTRRLLPEPGLVTIWLLVCVAAMYGCVPETDQLKPLAAALVVIMVLEHSQRAAIPIALQALAVAVVLWAGLYGATGRQRAVYGALFALWPLVLPAIVVRVAPRMRAASLRVRMIPPALAGLAALIVARTGALQFGRRPTVTAAAKWGAASLAAALVAALIVSLARRRRPTS